MNIVQIGSQIDQFIKKIIYIFLGYPSQRQSKNGKFPGPDTPGFRTQQSGGYPGAAGAYPGLPGAYPGSQGTNPNYGSGNPGYPMTGTPTYPGNSGYPPANNTGYPSNTPTYNPGTNTITQSPVTNPGIPGYPTNFGQGSPGQPSGSSGYPIGSPGGPPLGYPTGAPIYSGSAGIPGYPGNSVNNPGMTGYPPNPNPINPISPPGIPGYPANPGPGIPVRPPPHGTPGSLAYPLSPPQGTSTTGTGQLPLYPPLPNSDGNSGGWNVRPGF